MKDFATPPASRFLTKFPKKDKGRSLCVVPVFETDKGGEIKAGLDKTATAHLSRQLELDSAFQGKFAKTSLVTALEGDAAFTHYLLVGFGKADKLTAETLETLGGKLSSPVGAMNIASVYLDLTGLPAKVSADDIAVHLTTGLQLGSYSFTRYKTKKDETQKLEEIVLILAKSDKAEARLKRMEATTAATFVARDLVNMPPNYLLPDQYAHIIYDQLKPLGVDVTILDEKKMGTLGMGALLAVGQGSSNPPRLVVMEYNGKPKKGKNDKPLAFVGKGVTFDTGGISIKPAAGMEDMKLDMGGSAAVVGLMQALATRKAPVHVVGVVGLVENMPDGNSYRPADVLTSYSGKTIEVLNTDAEGRLVLADALTYVQKHYDPELIVDLATLTGAMMVALGYEYCGTFSNDDALWAKLDKGSQLSHEKLWRMPLCEAYTRQMDSPIADLKNLGTQSRYAGACTAAAFLEAFIDEGRPWAHMDVAGTAWIGASKPTAPKGGTGFGVRVLDSMIESAYE
ncbi:MAG: leucyl aminopeptidase [Pseudobdellovibrionaceae bacterium]